MKDTKKTHDKMKEKNIRIGIENKKKPKIENKKKPEKTNAKK